MTARALQLFTPGDGEQGEAPRERAATDAAISMAPVALLRAAAWPLERVRALVVEDESIDHVTRVERERQRLWACTAGSPAFMRALSLSNPPLAVEVERVYAELATRPRNKALRHLETTLYRTLARAAGRPQPCDLWAGTALAPFGERTRVEPAPRRIHAAPDLRPFAAMLAALRATPRHRGRGRFKLNPTIEVTTGAIALWRRTDDGKTVRCELRRSPALEQVLDAVEVGGIATLHEHAQRLGELGLDRARAKALLLHLVDHGLLVGGLALPTRFRCAWEALEAVPRMLHSSCAPAWRAAVERLRAIADRVVALVDAGSPATLRRLQSAARRCVEQLARVLGVDAPPIPRAALRCDASVPASVTLGPELRARLDASIRRYLSFQSEYGIGWDLYCAAVGTLPATTIGLAHVEHAPRYGGAPVWDGLLSTLGVSDSARARLRAWTRLLEQPHPVDVQPRAELDGVGTPVSLFSIGLRGDIERDPGFALRGSIDSVTAQYARHTPLWTGPGEPLDPFGRWLGERLREQGRRSGIRPVVLVGPSAGPNTLAQPELGLDTVEPWGTTTDALPLAGARIEVDPQSGLPWLRRRGAERHAVIAVTSASLGAGDPVSRALLLTGQFGSPVADMPAHTVPFAAELERETSSPRIDLDRDVVRTRRTVLAGERWRRLCSERDPARRYARWRALARQHAWPELVLVRRGGRGLVVPRDSAIAVGAALEGAGSEPFVVVEELDDHAWLTDADGQRYIAELGVAFVRPRHAWDSPTPMGPSGPTQEEQ
jgi:hypothetical protein